MLQERISWCGIKRLFDVIFFVLIVSIFCPCTHVRANVPIRLPPPSPISSLIGIKLTQQAPSQSSTITVLPPLISNDDQSSTTTPKPPNLATGVIDIKPLPFGYGASDLNDEEDDDHSSSSSRNDDNNDNNNDSGEESDSNDMHGKSGFGGARYFRGSRHDRNREKYKKQKSNSKTGHSATSGTGGSLKIDQGALHEHKQRETGHVDHDSHSNQDKFVKMIWDKGDGFVKRWHWDRGQKLKEAHSESEKKHLEHKDKAHSNELIERQKGEIAKKLANQGSKSNHLLDALDRQRSQAEGQLVNGFVQHEMNMHLKGPRKDHSIHGSLKRVRDNDSGNDGEENEDDDDRSSRKYKKYRNSRRSNPAIFKGEEEAEEDDEDQHQNSHRRKRPSKGYRHNRIASKFRRFPEGKLNEARKFFRGRNMIDSVAQAPEKDTETNVLEIEEKSVADNGDGDEQNDNSSLDKTKVRKMKNSGEDEHPEEEEDEEKEDENEREHSEGESDGSKKGRKKVKKERDFQRKITIKEEKTELKAHERLEDPKESKSEDEESEDQPKTEEEEDDEKPRKKKVFYKGSRGSGFIKQIRATSNGRDPSKKFDTIIEGEVPIEEVEEESSESRTIRGDQTRKAKNSVDRNQEEIKPLVRGDNISEIKIIKTAATNNQVRKNQSPSSNPSMEPSQSHQSPISPIILSPKPVNSISHLINPR